MNPHFLDRHKTHQEQSSSLNPAEAAIFRRLLAEEDSELKQRQKEAYRRSLVRETEVPQIENDQELGIFLALLESEVRKTGYLPDPEWQTRARDAYRRERNFTLNQRAIEQREILEKAVSKLEEGTKIMQDAISLYLNQAKPLETDITIELQSGCVLLIRGSYGLLSLTEKYLYLKQSRLKKALAKKLPMLNYSRFRREERIKHIRYILDYLQFVITTENQPNSLQIKRVQSYLKTLPLEAAHLAEWLSEEIDKQSKKGNFRSASKV